MRLVYLLACLGLILSVPVAAQVQTDEHLTLPADEPFGAWVNGLPVALAITTATIDHVILNDPVVQQVQLVAAPRDRIANLVIGGVVARPGRHGKALVVLADRLARQEIFWFPDASPTPADGSIGPFALPAATVTVRWGHAETTQYAWPLMGSIDRAAYGVAALGERLFVLGADVRMRRPLPVVSASTGADLVDVLGGRLVGPVWQEEIMLGIRRPVRRLQLDRPLVIGPLSFDAVAVRVGGPRDGTMWLSPRQQPLPDADADPAETLVRGRTAARRGVARMIVLSRNHLEAGGCVALTVAKRAQRFILQCKEPGPAVAAEANTAPVPLLPPAVPINRAVPGPVMTADGWLNIAADTPLAARIFDQPLTLLPDSGLPPAVFLNEATVARLPIVQADLAGEIRRGVGAVPMMAVTGIGTHVAGRTTPQMLAWAPGPGATGDNLFDGIIDLAALPHRRVRVRLPFSAQAPVQAPMPLGLPMVLPLTRPERFKAAGGDVRLPDVGRFVLHARLREELPLPVATPALAERLAARLGGQFDGMAEPAVLPFGIRTWLRTLRLAQPLVIGPLRFDAVAVETDAMGMIPKPPRGADVQRPYRALELSRRQLAEQGCTSLAIDREAWQWQIDCAGPAPPAATDRQPDISAAPPPR
ncbi:hypothetical protein [Sandarakinorhabdus sp.]|uniref:hypothetical protein n=1 Tax=Sandarakinorhabdus sp. TaxID=1916663 RepID=UPI003F70824C